MFNVDHIIARSDENKDASYSDDVIDEMVSEVMDFDELSVDVSKTTSASEAIKTPEVTVRRSSRVGKPVQKLNLFIAR